MSALFVNLTTPVTTELQHKLPVRRDWHHGRLRITNSGKVAVLLCDDNADDELTNDNVVDVYKSDGQFVCI